MILFVVYYLPDRIMGFVRQVLTLTSLRRGGRALVARDTGDESRVWGATATTTPPGGHVARRAFDGARCSIGRGGRATSFVGRLTRTLQAAA